MMRLDEMLLTENNNLLNYDSDNDESLQTKPQEPFEQLFNEDCQEILLPGSDDILKDSDDPMDFNTKVKKITSAGSANYEENEENLLDDLNGISDEMGL